MTSKKLANQGVSWEVEVRFSHQQRPWGFERAGKRQQGSDILAPRKYIWNSVREVSTCPRRFPICRSLEVPGEALCQPNVSVRCLFSDTCQPQQLPFSDVPCVAGTLLQALPDLIWWPSTHTQDRDYPPTLAGKKTTQKSVRDRVTMLLV